MKDSEIILYTTPNGNVKIEIRFEEETFWLTQKKLAELFDVDVRTVSEHLKNIFESGELAKDATIRKIRIVQTEDAREVSREVDFYNLDAIIAVGYRVNSYNATQFRIWATQTLKEFIIKGFVLDDERLKQGQAFCKDYFDELLERIVTMYLDYAENQSARQIPMKMQDWVTKLDAFLDFNDYQILKDAGKMSAIVAKKLAETQYKKYAPIQDQNFVSDFDKAIQNIQNKQR